MDDQLYSIITSFYNTTSRTERHAAEGELHRIQSEASIWSLFPSCFQDGRPHCDIFAAQTLHIKINRDLEQFDGDPVHLRESIQTWTSLAGSKSVKSKLHQALATLLIKTERHPMEYALGSVDLLSIIPGECERASSSSLHTLRHELKASAVKAIESIASSPVNEPWLECIKSWSIHLDQVPSWLIDAVHNQLEEHLSLVVDILCIWFARRGTEALLQLLPTITSNCSEEGIGEMSRVYGTYGEHHANYLCLDPQEHFFTNALHLTRAITHANQTLAMMIPSWFVTSGSSGIYSTKQ